MSKRAHTEPPRRLDAPGLEPEFVAEENRHLNEQIALFVGIRDSLECGTDQWVKHCARFGLKDTYVGVEFHHHDVHPIEYELGSTAEFSLHFTVHGPTETFIWMSWCEDGDPDREIQIDLPTRALPLDRYALMEEATRLFRWHLLAEEFQRYLRAIRWLKRFQTRFKERFYAPRGSFVANIGAPRYARARDIHLNNNLL